MLNSVIFSGYSNLKTNGTLFKNRLFDLLGVSQKNQKRLYMLAASAHILMRARSGGGWRMRMT